MSGEAAETAVGNAGRKLAGGVNVAAVAYLLADAAVFVAVSYLCVRAALLRVEGQFTIVSAFDVFFFTAVFIFVSGFINEKLAGGRMFAGMAADAFFLAVAVMAAVLIDRFGISGIDGAVVPFAVIRFPVDLMCFARMSPSAAIIFAGVFACLAVAATRFERKRFVSRAALLAVAALFYAAFAFGVLPFGGEAFKGARGVEKIADYASDVQPAPEGGKGVWIADAKRGSIVRISADGKKKEMLELKGISCDMLAGGGADSVVYAAESATAKAFAFSDGGAAQMNLATDRGGVLNGVLPYDYKLYTLYDLKPGVAEFDARTGEETGGIDFMNPRATAFRTGGRALAWSEPAETLFVLAGEADVKGDALLLAIDPLRFKITAMALMPGGGYAMAANPGAMTVYVADAHRPRIYEVDLREMKAVRTLDGPTGARAMAFDAKRKLIYAAGWYDGVLAAVDAGSGKILKKVNAGKHVRSLKVDAKMNYLYVVSSAGAFRVDLARIFHDKNP